MADPTEWFDETYVWVEADFTRAAELLDRFPPRNWVTATTAEPELHVKVYPYLFAIPRETALDWGLPVAPPQPRPIDVALDILRPHLAWQPLYRPVP